MPSREAEQLDEIIRKVEQRLERLRHLRAMVEEDRAFLTEVSDIFLNPACNGIPNPERATAAREPGLPKYHRVKEFILSKGNEWQSVLGISNGTQISRSSVNEILYKGNHKQDFESNRTSPKRTFWRVKSGSPTGELPVTSESNSADEQVPPKPKGPKPKYHRGD